MPKRCKPPPDWRELQDRIIGLGGDSIKKSHYPELRDRLRELERFRSLLDLSSDILLVIDIASARIVDWNVAARTALGCASPPTLTEIEATAIAVLLQEETANPTEHPRRTTLSATFRRADGSRFPAEIAISIEAGNGNRQAIAVGRDITERIATERRLRRAATACYRRWRHGWQARSTPTIWWRTCPATSSRSCWRILPPPRTPRRWRARFCCPFRTPSTSTASSPYRSGYPCSRPTGKAPAPSCAIATPPSIRRKRTAADAFESIPTTSPTPPSRTCKSKPASAARSRRAAWNCTISHKSA